MASCYICGQNGSNYRRTVITGYSTGSYHGKTTSHSSRTYYGIRTLCENCAFNHDKRKIVKGIILRWVIVIILVIFIFNKK